MHFFSTLGEEKEIRIHALVVKVVVNPPPSPVATIPLMTIPKDNLLFPTNYHLQEEC